MLSQPTAEGSNVASFRSAATSSFTAPTISRLRYRVVRASYTSILKQSLRGRSFWSLNSACLHYFLTNWFICKDRQLFHQRYYAEVRASPLMIRERSSQFVPYLLQHILGSCTVVNIFPSGCHPQTNGLRERFYHTPSDDFLVDVSYTHGNRDNLIKHFTFEFKTAV